MEIVYAAHTESGVFMLDAEGVCRWAVSLPGRTQEKVPERIVGAQYVATLDLDSKGGLVDLPRIGCPMLFAVTDENGRIRLLRTPPVLRFEDRRITIKAGPAPILDEDKTPSVPSTIPQPAVPPPTSPLPLVRPPQQSFAGALPPPPALPRTTRMTPLPPPPRARIAARLPPPPQTRPIQRQSEPPIPEHVRSPSGIRPAPNAPPAPIAVGVRVRAANMSVKRLVRGKA